LVVFVVSSSAKLCYYCVFLNYFSLVSFIICTSLSFYLFSYYYNQTFADVTKVEGLRGIYIASQLIQSNGSFSPENQRSLITFDKGGSWELINSPTVLDGQDNTNCTKVSIRFFNFVFVVCVGSWVCGSLPTVQNGPPNINCLKVKIACHSVAAPPTPKSLNSNCKSCMPSSPVGEAKKTAAAWELHAALYFCMPQRTLVVPQAPKRFCYREKVGDFSGLLPKCL
jgi:hypothetical protein